MQGAKKEKEMWELQRAPLQRAMAEQESVYKTLKKTPTYPLDPVVPFNPVQEKLQGYQTGYAFGNRPLDMQYGAENTLMNMLGGKTGYTGAQEQDILAGKIPSGPYNQMADAFRQQSEQGMLDNLATARTGIVENQAGGSSIGNRVQARAISDNQRDINAKLAGMNLGAYQTAQAARNPLAQLMSQQQLQGMSQYPGIMGAPTQFYGSVEQAVGTPQWALQQQMRSADKAAYDERRTNALANLESYTGGVTALGGGMGQMNTALAGLLNPK